MTDSLPQRMREAAEVLREVDRRHDRSSCFSRPADHENLWRAGTLISYADRWEAEDAAADAEREALVEELARSLYGLIYEMGGWETHASPIWKEHARKLIAAGWTRAENMHNPGKAVTP